LEKALKLGADFVATGHYARLTTKYEKHTNIRKSEFKLLKGKDKEKDQSYFLWQLKQKQLKHILFPVGDYTKTEVRKLAKKFRLPVSEISESQEICFVPKTINEFLAKYLKTKPGKIVDMNGKVVGEHKGLHFYTIGQRKGIELPQGPYYVVDKDIKENVLIVSHNEKDLLKKELIAKNVSWICPPKFCFAKFGRAKARIRYKSKEASATVFILKGKKVRLVFDKPQRAITPGQSVVFYNGKELLGGGIIE
jgi:tRNA-specific 2-thiouridylase